MTVCAPPLEDYALLSGMNTAALISRDGSVDWWCPPRFDADAVFARLLGTPEHGQWSLAPTTGLSATGTPAPASRRRYLDNTLVLESEWDTPEGTVRILDLMPPHTDDNSPVQLIRIVEGVRGRVPMRSGLAVRPRYGSRRPRIRTVGDRFTIRTGTGSLWLDAEPPTRLHDASLLSEFTIAAGQRLAFALTWQPNFRPAPPIPDTATTLTRTTAYWRAFSERCSYTGPDRDTVTRSLITIKALAHAPTGALVAAPTTSLPEEIGGSRNWDYRYHWLRDGALAIAALTRHGHLDEARAWRTWLVRTLADGRPTQIMYGVGGERDLPERELGHLPGYENSAPVRIGNAAAGQLQLDVYGEVIDALHTARLHGLEPDPQADALQIALVHELAEQWQEPDEGIWEVRGPRRHFVHSKVMAWLALDRTVRLIESGRAAGPLEHWRALRDEIHQEVCEKGYDPVRNTFTQSYGSADLDAALLLIPIVGFLPPGDPRVTGTIDAVQRELTTADGFLLRYTTPGSDPGVDGLPGHEGAFLACTAWLVEALTMTGRAYEARVLFARLLALRSDLGLFAEEWDPVRKRHVGNYPQGFTSWALCDAAWRLGTASRARIPAQRPTIDEPAHIPAALPATNGARNSGATVLPAVTA
ncbi:glycoside hydrolase family 15 protein [Streptomyces sp. NPDC056716]|uniref:glycoside hydrolase family 15 protein n=1 Tax=unclassified Streptomyces TaxID=2593676 RepID=UPI00369DAC80